MFWLAFIPMPSASDAEAVIGANTTVSSFPPALPPPSRTTALTAHDKKEPLHPLVKTTRDIILRMTTALNQIFTALNAFYTQISNVLAFMRMAEAFSAMTRPFFPFAAPELTGPAQAALLPWSSHTAPALQWKPMPALPAPATMGKSVPPFWTPGTLPAAEQGLALSMAALYLVAVADLLPRLAQGLLAA